MGKLGAFLSTFTGVTFGQLLAAHFNGASLIQSIVIIVVLVPLLSLLSYRVFGRAK